jgi:4-hydroxybenzoyl-CoA thioesterase
MGLKHVHRMRIEWGDTDPARIVYYPQYFRWFDTACHHMFEAIGLSQHGMVKAGAAGMPIVEAHAEFKRPGYCADWIEVRAEVVEVGSKVIRIAYQVWRDDLMLLEGYEKRVIADHHPDDPQRMVAQVIGPELRARLLG